MPWQRCSRASMRSVDAGFILQIDDPGLADKFGMFYPSLQKSSASTPSCALKLPTALSNIPEERVRYHTCWGSWHTPHTTDIPFKHIGPPAQS